MGRTYRRRVYRGSRDKYSVEQSVFDGLLTRGQTTVIDVVPPTTLQGMRKVKHLTISAATAGNDTHYGILWALVYVPQGVTVPGFNVTSGSPLLEPNQYVMNCGAFDSDAGPLRVSSRISRNLNSGDRIVLLLLPTTSTTGNPVAVTGVVRYAITLQ